MDSIVVSVLEYLIVYIRPRKYSTQIGENFVIFNVPAPVRQFSCKLQI